MAKKTDDYSLVRDFLISLTEGNDKKSQNEFTEKAEKFISLLQQESDGAECYISTINIVQGIMIVDRTCSECLIAVNSERAVRDLIRRIKNYEEFDFYFDKIYYSVIKEYIYCRIEDSETFHIKGQRKADPDQTGQSIKVRGERLIANKKDEVVSEFKKLTALKSRIETGHIVIEGSLMVKRALKDNLTVEKVVFSDSILPEDKQEIITLCEENSIVYYRVSQGIMSVMTTTNPTPEVICTAKIKNLDQNELIISDKKNFFLILDGISNPDNLGMVLRTADASGVDAVILLSPSTHHFNKNSIRGARGAVGRIPIYFCSDDFKLMDVLLKHNFRIWGTSARFEASNFYDISFASDNLAVVVGNESNGVRKEILDKCTDYVKIPMVEGQSSLNIAVAAALVLYEYDRGFYLGNG